jgi:hypothetical protein
VADKRFQRLDCPAIRDISARISGGLPETLEFGLSRQQMQETTAIFQMNRRFSIAPMMDGAPIKGIR